MGVMIKARVRTGGPRIVPIVLTLADIRFDRPSPRDGTRGFSLRVPSFELDRGESVAIIGPSGCGKTTLLRLAAGIIAPSSGQVTLDGRDLGALGETARRSLRLARVGIVFQDFRLLPHLTVEENVLLPFRLGSLRLDAFARSRARDLLDRLGIGDLARRSVERLSQGEQQRTAICRALVTDPGLVLADEPTGNLDPANKRLILDALLDAARSRSAAVLAVTHDHDLLDAFDRVIDLGVEVEP
jgi:putative ABC transport system ATP-binding protein